MMQVFDQNLLDEAVSKTVSSAASEYPVTNVFDLTRRRKTWRSAGYWNVESGANTIVFREASGGSDLTATIAAAEYATDTAFIAAIKAALDAAGAATYTVSRNGTTGKITILSDGGGGATAFELRWLTADDFGTILGFDTSANDTGALSYTADELRIHTEEYFIFDFGAATNPTGFVAVSDRNDPINISPTATVKLQANPTNSWASPAEEFTITVRDFVLAYANEDGIAALAGGYRYWKLKIVDNDNPDLFLELGAMFFGLHVVLARGSPEYPIRTRGIDPSIKDISESGQAWIGKKPKTKVHAFNWCKLTNADFALLEGVWDTYGMDSPFFVAFDPDNIMRADGLEWTRLCYFDEEPEGEYISPGHWNYPWRLREAL